MDKKQLTELEKNLTDCLNTFNSNYQNLSAVGSNKADRKKSQNDYEHAIWLAARYCSESEIYKYLKDNGGVIANIIHTDSKAAGFSYDIKQLLFEIKKIKSTT